MKIHLVLVLACLITFAETTEAAPAFQIALTIEDFPLENPKDPQAGEKTTDTIIRTLKKHRIKGVYGFVIGNRVKDKPAGQKAIAKWLKEGHFIGNATFSDIDFSKSELPIFLEDVKKNDELLKQISNKTNFKFFRFPYFAEGDTLEKRQGARAFLKTIGYTIAPITADFFSTEWKWPYQRCLDKKDNASILWLKSNILTQAEKSVEKARLLSELVFGRNIRQIFVIQADPLQVEMLDSIITKLKAQGAKFVSLPEALSDPAYKNDTGIVKPRTYTLLSQVRDAKHLKNPARVDKINNEFPNERLLTICK